MIIDDRDKEYSWRSKKSNPQAQIDLLIHKKDMIINLCDIKYSNLEFQIIKEYEQNLKKWKFLELK